MPNSHPNSSVMASVTLITSDLEVIDLSNYLEILII